MLKHKKTKKYAQRIHAMGRIREKDRYGIDITDDQYQRLCSYIKKGKLEYPDGTKLTFLHRQSLRVTIWRIVWNERTIIAVWDKNSKAIATFLPLEWEARMGFNGQDDSLS